MGISLVATRWRHSEEKRQRLTSRLAGDLPFSAKPRIVYDPDLIGFGLRITPPTRKFRSGTRTWIVEYRPGVGGRRTAKRRVSLGRIELVSADEARRIARDILAQVVTSAADPAAERSRLRSSKTLSELKQEYLDATNPFRKPRTRELYEGLWRIHIEPALGSRQIDAVTKGDVLTLHADIGKAHPSTANRTIILLSHFFGWCTELEYIGTDRNPARGIRKFPAKHRDRYLSRDEFCRLGQAIRLAETEGIPWEPRPGKKVKHAPKLENRKIKIGRHAAAALRLLIFTGARLREILNLEWRQVDLESGVLVLPDSKTGAKRIILPAPAIETLTSLAKVRSKDAKAKFVIEGEDPSRPRADLQRPWKLVRDHAALCDFRLHDLRHSFASVGAGSNLGLPVIGALLGHSNPSTTARYAHLANEPLRAASEDIANRISEMIDG
jgi:integrase